MLSTGQVLSRERQNKNLTLEDIERATRIRKKNLIAIEAGDCKKFPSKTYVVGVIKTYGDFLDLDSEKLSAFFRREYEKKDESGFKQRLSTDELTTNRKKLFKILTGLILAFFLIYFSYQMKIYFSPPKVEITAPKKNSFVNENKIELVGKVEKEATVTVNGDHIFTDKENVFRTFIPLTEKQNKVIIVVTGANGKKTTIEKLYFKR